MSDALEEVVNYLLKKVSKVNVANPKANSGGVLLKLHLTLEEDIHKFVCKAFHNMQVQFAWETTKRDKAKASLTNTSMRIGKAIGKEIRRDPLPYHQEIRLGDVFIEAFDYCEFIDLEYKAIRTEGYNIHCGARWEELASTPMAEHEELLFATTEIKPVDVTEFYQHTGQRLQAIIKKPEDWYKVDYEAAWVQALNKLQQTAWRVNSKVLEVVIKNPPSDAPLDDPLLEAKRQSKKVEYQFVVDKAVDLVGKTFYQYGEFDYRGRFYYSESFFNFQGADKARGMFLFDEGKPLTSRGLDWLAVHSANSYNQSYKIDEIPEWCTSDYTSYLKAEELEDISLDKMTLRDRYEWAMQNMEMILAADNLDANAEKPVAFLAACLEWQGYAEDGEDFISHLPIPIDGSNNGWQHLGAISKDTHTGKLVGLVPVEIQKDFYVQTAKEMIKLNTKERLTDILEQMPMKKIRKGISKRGSMTRAYSAGANKIAGNMYLDCRQEEYHIDYGITEDDCKGFAKTLIKAIDNVCPGPLETMGYLQKLAGHKIGKYKKIQVDGEGTSKDYEDLKRRRQQLNENWAKSKEELEELNEISLAMFKYNNVLVSGEGADRIAWTSPSGFDVRYESYKMQKHRTRGTISGRQINHVIALPSTIPDFQGFMSGISPNFIHSQDAAHLALTVVAWDGPFGAVHDSFSAHASDIDELLHVTKSTFIEIYDHSNYFDIIRENITNDADDVEQPALGSLNIQEIHNSDYFFA